MILDLTKKEIDHLREILRKDAFDQLTLTVDYETSVSILKKIHTLCKD